MGIRSTTELCLLLPTESLIRNSLNHFFGWDKLLPLLHPVFQLICILSLLKFDYLLICIFNYLVCMVYAFCTCLWGVLARVCTEARDWYGFSAFVLLPLSLSEVAYRACYFLQCTSQKVLNKWIIIFCFLYLSSFHWICWFFFKP